MSFIEIVLIAVGLAMDAFAVSVCRGLKMRKIDYGQTVKIALCFGGFQALMPFIGYVLGTSFESYIVSFDHWVVFLLLIFIGGKMVWEAVKGENDECEDCGGSLKLRELLLLGIATSIDALAVGITLALLPNSNIGLSVLTIGVITFAISFAGVAVGNRFGSKYKSKAELAGGVILILIGVKILLDHLVFNAG